MNFPLPIHRKPESKFMDGWFNNNRTNFGEKAMNTNDAITPTEKKNETNFL